ncbi:SafA/ExsA family spore coat assembly protein [Cytobacillus suaedae]|nr:SafA/ExsA family spore coat assembly protein [Cytobacillus suaedae]
MKIHVVQKGDTLWNISKKYGVDFEELKKMNTQLSNPDMIMPGMKIKVPTGNVPVKKEMQTNVGTVKESVKKEAPIAAKKEAPIAAKKEAPKKEAVHPYADKSPQPLPVMETKEEIKEKKVPYTPKMPTPSPINIEGNKLNMLNLESLKAPSAPPILPGMMQPEEKQQVAGVQEKAPKKAPQVAGVQEKVPKKAPQVAGIQEKAPYQAPQVAGVQEEFPQPAPMPTAPVGYTPPQPAEYPCVPMSPVLPGSGLGPFASPLVPPFQQGAPMPMGNPGYPQGINPAMFDDDDDDLPPPMPNVGHTPPMGYGASPMPHFQMPNYVAGAQTAHKNDCGCGGQMMPAGYNQPMGLPHQGFGATPPGYNMPYGMPQQGFAGVGAPQPYGMPQQPLGGFQQPFGVPQQPLGGFQQPYGVPQQPLSGFQQPFGGPQQGFGGYPQQPYTGPQQGLNPYGQGLQPGFTPNPGMPTVPGGAPYGVNPGQPMPYNQNPMFTMPDFDDDDLD